MVTFAVRAVLAVTLLTTVALAPSRADARPGVRGGLTDDIDTLFVGFFYEAPLAWTGSGFFAIEPSIDLGFADDLDAITIRGSFNGKFLIPAGRAFVYPIFGLSLYYIDFDCPAGDCDHTSTGLNLGLGTRIEPVNFELTFGIDDLPDITFSVGVLF